MKCIEISGKHNVDKINKIETPKRKDTEKWKLDSKCYSHTSQVSFINRMYLGESIENGDIITREINKKITGYKNQDIQKSVLNPELLISNDQVLELMVNSKLSCFYCKDGCDVLYTTVLYKKQWTLDRINNGLGHNYNNVVICCLDCNIKRGDMDSTRFKKGKDIKIVKKQF
jgi:5-methylcytosine-specific restriction endonuclease McrA